MTSLQKIFLMSTVMYLSAKLVLGFILYLVTKKVEEKALVQKKHRARLVRSQRARNLELYRQQYRKAMGRKDRGLVAMA